MISFFFLNVLLAGEAFGNHAVMQAAEFAGFKQAMIEENDVLEIISSQVDGKAIWMVDDGTPITIKGKIIAHCFLEIHSPSGIYLEEGSSICSSGLKIVSEGQIGANGSIITKGFPVCITAKQIELKDAAFINTSSDSAGGTVFIGGGWHGQDPAFPNAKNVSLDANASIVTDAFNDGIAGDVVIWSDNATQFRGSISARGEKAGGNVEISSGNFLYFDGFADTASSKGKCGTLWIDPATIVVQASNPDIQGNGTNQDIAAANQLSNPSTYPGADSIITAGAVNALLTGGTSMTLSATNSIAINSPIAASGVVTALTLNAPVVNLNQPITLPFGGVLNGTASEVHVGPSGIIQDGVDVAAAGGTVNLASATYVQEVFIGKNLTLNGNGIGNTAIVCPTIPAPLENTFIYAINGATYHPIILAEGSPDIIIQNMTVDGNSQPTNFLNYRFVGIGYHNAGGTVQNTRITNIEDSFPAGGTQHGFGIFGAIDSGPYEINVLNNIVDHFQKQAITMRGPTLTTTISGNVVIGEIPPSAATMNGIVIQDNAAAEVLNNTVSNIISATPGVSSVSIFFFGAGSSSMIANNTINDTDIGIYSYGAGDGLNILDNGIVNLSVAGIYVQDTNGLTTLSTNEISCSAAGPAIMGSRVEDPDTGVAVGRVFVGATPTYNMYLISSANYSFQLSSNIFNSCDIGLAVEGTGALGPQVSMDRDIFNGEPTYYIQLINNPNDIWPTTATVSFDGLVSGYITYAQYLEIQSRLLGNFQDPSLGIILEYLEPFAPEPVPSFAGTLKKDKLLNKTAYCLTARWTDSPSPNVVAYRIYYKGSLVKQVSAGSPHVFMTSLKHKDEVQFFTITAVNSLNLESPPTTLKVIHG